MTIEERMERMERVMFNLIQWIEQIQILPDDNHDHHINTFGLSYLLKELEDSND